MRIAGENWHSDVVTRIAELAIKTIRSHLVIKTHLVTNGMDCL